MIQISSEGDRPLLSAGLLVSDQSLRILDESLIRTLLYCCLLAEPTSLSKKNKKWKNKALIRPKCARRVYDQTPLRSSSPMIRPKCARIRLWSDFSDQNYLWSDHLQTIVQSVVSSNFRPDPVISVWEHTGVRSNGPDHKQFWVWTSVWDCFTFVCLMLRFGGLFLLCPDHNSL